MFISTATILCIYVFVFSWIHILSRKEPTWKAITHDILSDFLIVYCFVAVWFVGGLTIFHSYLISTNQTTYENFRYRYDKKENPYNMGLMRNVIEIFLTKIPTSMNKFRSFVEEDDSIVATPVMPNLGDAFVSSKEKIDIEMGAKHGEENNYSLPEILRNLDYDDDSEDNSKTKQEEGMPSSDPFLPNEQDAKLLLQISIVKDEVREPLQGSTTGDVECSTAGDGMEGPVQISNLEDNTRGNAATDVRESPESCAAEDGVRSSINSSAGEETNSVEEIKR